MPDNERKKTKLDTKPNPFPHLDDLDDLLGGSTNPPSTIEPERDDAQQQRHSDPDANGPAELPRASAERTRSVQATPSERMRDALNRLNDLDPGEITDQERARQHRGMGEPEEPSPVINQNMPVVANRLPAMLATELAVPNIEWHQIRNLPGFQKQQIRMMGDRVFGARTRTPVEDITAIAWLSPDAANLLPGSRRAGNNPRPPSESEYNTLEQLSSVGEWLRDHAQPMGSPDAPTHPHIPGYRADVREFVESGVRFQVVQDFIDDQRLGYYIYAWPEADTKAGTRTAREPSQLGRGQTYDMPGENSPPQDRPRLPRRESTIMIKKDASYLKEELEMHKRFIKEEYRFRVAEAILCKKLDEAIIKELLVESTLSRVIGKNPGGQHLVQWLHRRNKLGNDVEWAEHPFSERVMWSEFKNHPDNFLIVVGTRGVAGIKPNEQDIQSGEEAARRKRKVYNPARDNTLRYKVVAFVGDQQVNPDLFRQEGDVERDIDPTVMRARGGLVGRSDVRNDENIFDKMREQLGELKSVIISHRAVPRDVMAARASRDQPKYGVEDLPRLQIKLVSKLRPLLKKIAYECLSIITQRAQRAMTGGNFDAASEASATAVTIKNFITAVDTQGELNLGYGSPVKALINRSVDSVAPQDLMKRVEWYEDMLTPGDTVRKWEPMLAGVRTALMRKPGN